MFKLFQQNIPLFIHQHRPYRRPATLGSSFHDIFTCIDYIKEALYVILFYMHVNMFQYFEIPFIICTFFTRSIYNEHIRPYFYCTLFLRYSPVTPRASLFFFTRGLSVEGGISTVAKKTCYSLTQNIIVKYYHLDGYNERPSTVR